VTSQHDQPTGKPKSAYAMDADTWTPGATLVAQPLGQYPALKFSIGKRFLACNQETMSLA